jgi:hypothetical protein
MMLISIVVHGPQVGIGCRVVNSDTPDERLLAMTSTAG